MLHSSFSEATQAALKIAASFGVTARTGRLIGGYSNTLIRLEPLPLVARVAAATMAVRPNSEWMQREVAVAEYLAANGSKTARPAQLLPAGPHRCDGFTMTFWDFLEIYPNTPEPRQTACQLSELHAALASYPKGLPHLTPLVEALSILSRPELIQPLEDEAQFIVLRAIQRINTELDGQIFECRPLHGDAHHGNLWQTANGLVWGDFEDTCSGPIEWDMACLVASSYVFGNGGAADAAIQGYGCKLDLKLLDLLIEARTLQGIAWALISLPEPAINQRLQRRLKWLGLRS